MQLEQVRDREELEAFLRKNAAVHLYEIGDLDEFFWPDTVWYAHRSHRQIEQLALLYLGAALPTLLALCPEQERSMGRLLRAVADQLPGRVYAHLSAGLVRELEPAYVGQSHGQHDKMLLADPSRLETVSTAGVTPLGRADRAALQQLYERAYPDNWFVPRMLETGQYLGIVDDGELACAAGVHVYSARYRVAALGNVATLPRCRGQAMATRACAALCRQLLRSVDLVGLNVLSANAAAIACYRKLGFERVATYEEWQLERIDQGDVIRSGLSRTKDGR